MVVSLCLLVLVTVNSASANCAGKCFPGTTGQYQGKMILVSNEFADEGQPSSLEALRYFAYDDKLQRFYGKGFNWNKGGNKLPIEILQLNDQVTLLCSISLSPTVRSNLKCCLAADASRAIRRPQWYLHQRQTRNDRYSVCSRYTSSHLVLLARCSDKLK